MDDQKRLRRLAARVARERQVDWDAEERAARTAGGRDKIHALRMVATLAGFHRVAGSDPGDVDLSSSISTARGVIGQGTGPGTLPGTDLAPGARWGPFELIAPVGSGTFGTVYRARDTRLDRVVALKLMEQVAGTPAERTIREARLLARVRHPNVVTVHGADRIDGRVGLWMEFVQGETLEQLVRDRGTLGAGEASLIGVDLCRALAAVHGAGVIHQDVKLGNVMRAEGGRTVLMDFGLGREALVAPEFRGRRSLSGTPLYMAPEILRGAQADARSDIYSLGVVLFALVTGSTPVRGKNLAELLDHHAHRRVDHARDVRPDLPDALVRILDRALAADPAQRYSSCGEFERALVQSLGVEVSPTRTKGSRWPVLGLAALGLALAAGGGLWVGSRERIREATPVRAPLSDSPSLTLLGAHAGDMFGNAAGVGDVDQDGYQDVLISSPQCADGGRDAGKVSLHRGSSGGLEPDPAWTMTGRDADMLLGWSIAPFTSLTFDGFADLVVAAPGGPNALDKAGAVFVYLGSKSGPAQAPAQRLSSGCPGGRFGYAIASGDVNHDGSDDLLVGEPFYPSPDSAAGRAYLYLASGIAYPERPTQTFAGPPGSSFGMSVALGGDVNNDGYADAAVGAVTASLGSDFRSCGITYVYLGTAAGLDTIPTVLAGRQAGGEFGREVFFADVDGDRFSDLVVGASYGSQGEISEGIAEIFFGSKDGILPSGAILLQPDVMGANFGGHGASAGDLDGDGADEIFVGAVRYQRTEAREGAAFVYRVSPDRVVNTSWFRMGGKPGSWYGSAGGSAGDVDSDGFPDFFVGACAWDSDAGTNVGRFDLFLNTRRR